MRSDEGASPPRPIPAPDGRLGDARADAVPRRWRRGVLFAMVNTGAFRGLTPISMATSASRMARKRRTLPLRAPVPTEPASVPSGTTCFAIPLRLTHSYRHGARCRTDRGAQFCLPMRSARDSSTRCRAVGIDA
jgi:hypothetical protein